MKTRTGGEEISADDDLLLPIACRGHKNMAPYDAAIFSLALYPCCGPCAWAMGPWGEGGLEWHRSFLDWCEPCIDAVAIECLALSRRRTRRENTEAQRAGYAGWVANPKAAFSPPVSEYGSCG